MLILTPFSRAVQTTVSASATVTVNGFSHSTFTPRSMKSRQISAWLDGGVHTSTASSWVATAIAWCDAKAGQPSTSPRDFAASSRVSATATASASPQPWKAWP